MEYIENIRKNAFLLKQKLPQSITCIDDFDRENLLSIFKLANLIENAPVNDLKQLLQGKVLATLFYQPSTRTRLNFEAAAQRLGMSVIGFADPSTTRAGDYYQETLEDVIRFTSELCDLIALRHFEAGAANRAVSNSIVPIINAGDGYNQHPTQALGDLFTMYKCLSRFEDMKIGLIGDLNVRSLKSITIGLCELGVKEIVFKIPNNKVIPPILIENLSQKNIKYSIENSLKNILDKCNLVETIGINHPDHSKGRDCDKKSYSEDKSWIIDLDLIKQLKKPPPFLLHPAPRTNEINRDIDHLSVSKYFEQARNGMFVRMALILILMVEL